MIFESLAGKEAYLITQAIRVGELGVATIQGY